MHGPREQPAGAPDLPITIPQSGPIHRNGHAALTICGFIRPRGWSMIHIMQSGKR